MSLLISNVALFDGSSGTGIKTDQAVAVEGAEIIAVGPADAVSHGFGEAELLDGGGRLLMPGLINVHMHFYGTYARGLTLDEQPRNFVEILERLWWRLDRALDLDAVYYSTLVAAITAVKNGCTAVIDHHSSPNAVEGSLDRIEEALALVGMRGILCYEVSDRDGKGVRDRGMEENRRYLRKCRQRCADQAHHPFAALMGLHAAFTLDDDSLEKAAAISRSYGRGCHIHLLEDSADRSLCLRKYGLEPLVRLDRFGLLGPNSIAAHAVHVSEENLDVLAGSGVILTHQAQSNMNNAVGRAEIFELLRRGVRVGIGTDGMTPDVRAETRTAYLLHKHHLADPNAGWQELQSMLFRHNPQIYESLSGQRVGRIERGALADLILVDYFPPTPLSADNFWGHFLYGIADAPVNTTIIHGKIVMRDGELPHLDEEKIASASRLSAEAVWKRFHA